MPTRDDGLVSLAKEMGSLAGSQQAVLSELQRLSTELVRLQTELDKKHEENIKKIDERHSENLSALNIHKEEDSRNFQKIFRIWNMVSGGAALLLFLWAIAKFFLPIILAAKGLGE